MNMPMQPIHIDNDGVARFVPNRIVRFLLDAGPFDLNQIAVMGFTQEEHEQLAQLIGYSVSGFGDLSYVHPNAVEEADAIVEKMMASCICHETVVGKNVCPVHGPHPAAEGGA